MMKRLIEYILKIRTRQLTRKQLLDLDNNSLKDLGISRSEANSEADKHFWQ